MKFFCRAALVLAVIAASALGVNAQAPQQGRVIGRVLDAINASPLPGVTVEVAGTSHTTVTDLDGKYALQLPLGPHQIRIGLSGFADKVVTVNLTTTAARTLDVTLALAVKVRRAPYPSPPARAAGGQRVDYTGDVAISSERDLTSADLAQLAAVGIEPDVAAAFLNLLRHPPPPIALVRPATLGDGIARISASDETDTEALLTGAASAAAAGRVMTFVPASGAATRMFSDLTSALQDRRQPSESPAVREFFARLADFPFRDALRQRCGLAPGTDADERLVLHTLLVECRLSALPKALVPFHRGARVRTAFEEHLREASRYTRDADDVSRVHFTIPTDTLASFESSLAAVRPLVEADGQNVRLSVTFSTQQPATDTLALDDQGRPLRRADGALVLRPSGHGALLQNLQDSGGDILVVKNIDNVLPSDASDEVVHWKRLLIGYLARLQATVFAHLHGITVPSPSPADVDAARAFAAAQFGRVVSADAPASDITAALHRPLRVCGVVRNDGEPGGAPFWVRHADGRESLQIVEPAQVALDDPEQARLFARATHFNPVDLICGLRGYDGRPFELASFVDPHTAFVTRKTVDGRPITALERPGLWNGSMAGWNTVFVEVPGSTFAPVKTVFDLLRPQHQSAR
ncbi:MAG: DUF4301 family protein [Acidimicrobiia bacterium]|nr:DUF4301 family protein [Acidimicrobiia bacterium]